MRDHALGHKEYFEPLTGLRGFAALWVFLYHLFVYSRPQLITLDTGLFELDFTPLFTNGWAGVDFFFVLSAFLLTLPFAHWACGERAFPEKRVFLVKRFRRIFPAYWAQLAILLVLAGFTTAYAFPSLTGLVTHLAILLNLPPWWTHPLNGVWWTLPTELLFYLLLLPLALLLKWRSGRFLLVGLMACAWLYRWWVFQNFQDDGIGRMVNLMGNTLGYLDQFIIGMFCSWFYVRRLHQGARPLAPGLFLAAGLAGVLLFSYTTHWLYDLYWAGHPLLYLKNTLLGISIAAIVIACIGSSGLARRLFGNRVMVHMGIISYSVYLWHFPVIYLLSKWRFIADWPGFRFWVLAAFAVPITWVISYLSYRWVERPFLQTGSRNRDT